MSPADIESMEPEQGDGRPAKKGKNRRGAHEGVILPPGNDKKPVSKAILEARKGKDNAEDATVVDSDTEEPTADGDDKKPTDDTHITLHAPAGHNVDITVSPKDSEEPVKAPDDGDPSDDTPTPETTSAGGTEGQPSGAQPETDGVDGSSESLDERLDREVIDALSNGADGRTATAEESVKDQNDASAGPKDETKGKEESKDKSKTDKPKRSSSRRTRTLAKGVTISHPAKMPKLDATMVTLDRLSPSTLAVILRSI